VYANEVMADRVLKSDGFKLKDHCAALEASFEQVEKEFLGLAERDGLSDGTTAVVALVQADRLTVAHVGDSRGVLCRNGNALALTQDHKPEIAAERRRIEALGGFVSYIGCWRAMGILAMSRAIGDLFLKPYVSAKPDVSTMSIGPTDEFIVLASDGVFDVFDNDQVVRIVRAADDPQHAASLLTKSALAAGSLDNITAIVVALRGYKPRQLDGPRSPAEEPRGVLASSARDKAAWSDRSNSVYSALCAASASAYSAAAVVNAASSVAYSAVSRAVSAYSVAEAVPAYPASMGLLDVALAGFVPSSGAEGHHLANSQQRLRELVPELSRRVCGGLARGTVSLPASTAHALTVERTRSLWETRFESWHGAFEAIEGC